jgi:NADH:ubiquinone oxidoreductase subunit F (NADH-binding)
LLLDRMIAGDGPENGRQQLQELASVLEKDSLCGLGQSAAWPINTALNHFSDAFVG